MGKTGWLFEQILIRTRDKHGENAEQFKSRQVLSTSSHLAATARRFLALAAPGSTDRDLAASSSLLDAMEMFLRLPMTWIWSSLLWKRKGKGKKLQETIETFKIESEHSGMLSKIPGTIPVSFTTVTGNLIPTSYTHWALH